MYYNNVYFYHFYHFRTLYKYKLSLLSTVSFIIYFGLHNYTVFLIPSLREKRKSISCRRARFSWSPFQEHLDTDFHLTLILHLSWTFN